MNLTWGRFSCWPTGAQPFPVSPSPCRKITVALCAPLDCCVMLLPKLYDILGVVLLLTLFCACRVNACAVFGRDNDRQNASGSVQQLRSDRLETGTSAWDRSISLVATGLIWLFLVPQSRLRPQIAKSCPRRARLGHKKTLIGLCGFLNRPRITSEALL